MAKQNVDINFKLCVVCQCVKDEDLVENPTSYDKLVAAVKERASYGESRFSEIWSCLKVFSVKELEVKEGTWHRKCYQDAKHSGMLKRAKERYERVLSGPNESRQKTRNLQEAEPISHSFKDNPLQQSSVFLIFTKYFFAHDRLNYARMTYAEFKHGNWVVNKNPCIPFCVIGPDNASEH